MKKGKKILSILLSAALMLTAFAGCGKKSDDSSSKDNNNNNTSENSSANDVSSLKPVELTWYFIGNGQQKDVEMIEAKVNEYIKDKINATVKLQCYAWGEEYDNKLSQMIASSQNFDICFTAAWANNYVTNASKGAFVALNDDKKLFETYAPKTMALLGEDFLSGSQINGINYGIPANKEKAHSWGFLFNKDLVEKYKLDISSVKSLEDLEPLLKVIKENEPNVYPLEALNGESPYKLLDWDTVGDDKCPGVVTNDTTDLKVFNEFETEEAMQIFKTLREYYLAGYIRQDAMTVTDYNADEAAGKIFCATKSLKPGKDAEMTLSSGINWTQVYITPAVISNRDTMGSLQAISSTSKNPERALMFLELFNTDEYLNNLINYGIEGTHYEKISDKVIKAAAGVDGYNPGTGWMFGNQFLNYLNEKEESDKWSKFEEFNASATATKTLGFNFDATPVKSQIAAINSLWDEYVPSLETGSVDPEEYLPKFIKELKAAGIDDVIAEKQKQLDKWAEEQGKK